MYVCIMYDVCMYVCMYVSIFVSIYLCSYDLDSLFLGLQKPTIGWMPLALEKAGSVRTGKSTEPFPPKFGITRCDRYGMSLPVR